jgi:hypothetical protein
MKKKRKPAAKKAKGVALPSPQIAARTHNPTDWRAQTLAHIRLLIQQADPDVV